MNDTATSSTSPNGGLLNSVLGGQPVDFNVTFDTKSLMILGAVIVLAGIIIIAFNKFT